MAVLPPLLYGAAFFTSLRDLRENAFAITLLAIGLVLCTMVVVALVAHELIPASAGEAPRPRGGRLAHRPDRSHGDRRAAGPAARLVALIEGESLVNDGTALVAYKFAVVAVDKRHARSATRAEPSS